MTTETTNTTGQIEVDPQWGALPKGEAARIFGAGDPREITAGAQPAQEDNES